MEDNERGNINDTPREPQYSGAVSNGITPDGYNMERNTENNVNEGSKNINISNEDIRNFYEPTEYMQDQALKNQYMSQPDLFIADGNRGGEYSDFGNIKFRKKRENSKRIKGFFKALSLVLVAAVSGGVTSAYMVKNKYNTAPYAPNSMSLTEQKDSKITTANIPRNAINRVAETVGPTVVGISNQEESFYGETETGSGSGIIFDSRGYIVTNYHVIKGADSVVVKLANRSKPFKAKFIGADPSTDLAVIKIDAQNLPVAKFGDSSKVKVGDIAIAIGNPLGDEFAGSVTSGIISAVNRKIQMGKTTYRLLQTDAAINPGNSGGALCNEAGEIIGINSLKLGGQDNIEGMGFAININEANEVIKKIMNNKSSSSGNAGTNDNASGNSSGNSGNSGSSGGTGSVQTSQAILGVQGVDAKPEDANGLSGVYVETVMPNSGAEAAGIKPADVIIEFDGAKVTGFDNLKSLVSKHKIDDEIICKIWREGKTLELKVKLTEIKSQ